MEQPDKLIKLKQWIHGSQCVAEVVVEAIVTSEEPDMPYLRPDTVRHLELLQQLADAGDVAELAKHGTVYQRVAEKVPA